MPGVRKFFYPSDIQPPASQTDTILINLTTAPDAMEQVKKVFRGIFKKKKAAKEEGKTDAKPTDTKPDAAADPTKTETPAPTETKPAEPVPAEGAATAAKETAETAPAATGEKSPEDCTTECSV